jgi:gamma-glutamylcyclotransferase (GGCT)/AIG2-like uncharacterized protein YtfP
MKLFVYGTLCRGEKNHHLLYGAICIVERATINAKMYDTKRGYPAIELDLNSVVVGEVYEVSNDMWPALDELEGFTGNREMDLYNKIKINVITEEGPIETFVYTVCDETMKSIHISSGDWVAYRKSLEID